MNLQAPQRVETASAFQFFRVEVARVTWLQPHKVRITFTGAELVGMTSGGLDQRIKVLFPQVGQIEPVLPEDRGDFTAFRALPEAVRPWMRTYTIRAHRPADAEFDVDFVVHGDEGPGSAFALRAQPGDRAGVYAPNAVYPHGPRIGGVEYKLHQARSNTLILGDDTAAPAINSIIEALPATVQATVLLESNDVVDERTSAARIHFRNVPRDHTPGRALLAAVRELRIPGDCYTWIAGESGLVRTLRRCLINEHGVDRKDITFMGYWRCGFTEDTAHQ